MLVSLSQLTRPYMIRLSPTSPATVPTPAPRMMAPLLVLKHDKQTSSTHPLYSLFSLQTGSSAVVQILTYYTSV